MCSDSADSITDDSVEVVVALGANLGDPLAQLRFAARELEKISIRPLRYSSVWETQPVDCPPGSPVFANTIILAVAGADESPKAWLDQFQDWERQAGRLPKRMLNEARPLDVDLIAWGRRQLSTDRLVLPHPRAHLRRFVLEPLVELLPEWYLPGQLKPVRDLLEGLPPDSTFRKWVSAPEFSFLCRN